ncbi:pentatricopeptide repeat (PPR) superfamily protein [Wolffia australiana]
MAVRLQPWQPLRFFFPATARSRPSLRLVSPTLLSSSILNSVSPLASSNPCAESSSPVFLRHLELVEEELHKEVEVCEDSDEAVLNFYDDDERVDDPIRSFLESKTLTPDPAQEGSIFLQKNRRTSWRMAGSLDACDEDLEGITLGLDFEPETQVLPSEDEGIVGEILRLSRNIPKNSTLGELLGPFEGKLEEGDCIRLLARLGKEGLTSQCLYLFEWMGLQQPSLVTPRSCSVLFPALGRAGKWKELVTLFKNLPKSKRFKDVHVYNAAVSGLASSGRYDDAWAAYEAMEANNVKPDNVTCSILITIMGKSERSTKQVWEFFQLMNKKGVKIGIEAFGALIKCFCDAGLKKEALIVQSEMEKRGIPSNTLIYNTLMDAYVKSNNIEEAEGLFQEMREKSLHPSTATYNILMDGYSRRMQPNIIEDLMQEMQSAGLKPNVRSFTCLISAYGRQRKLSDMAADAFFKMKKSGIKPTSHSYTALIHAFSVGGWHEKAFSAFESMKRDGLEPSIETYTALLDAFRRAGDSNKLVEIWRMMMKDKVEGTRVTFNIVLDGLAKNGLYALARDVVSEFEQIGIPPSVMTYNMLMNAYGRGGQHYKLPQLLKEMSALSLKPDSITYMTMIYAYVRVRDFSKAHFYHKEMVRSGLAPDAESYRKLRAILEDKAQVKNRRDKSAMLGIINSSIGLFKKKKVKKDEFWKHKKKRPGTSSSVDR